MCGHLSKIQKNVEIPEKFKKVARESSKIHKNSKNIEKLKIILNLSFLGKIASKLSKIQKKSKNIENASAKEGGKKSLGSVGWRQARAKNSPRTGDGSSHP